MKKSYFCFVIFITVITVSLHAQSKKNRHRVRIEFYSGEIAKGDIMDLNDSSIRIFSRNSPGGDTVFPITAIKNLWFRGRNAQTKGMITGAVIGVSAGLLLGGKYSLSDDCFPCWNGEPGNNTLKFATSGALTGVLIGFFSGSQFRKYGINGDYPMYYQARKKILHYRSSIFEKPDYENLDIEVLDGGVD